MPTQPVEPGSEVIPYTDRRHSGRPSKLTPEVRRIFMHQISLGLSIGWASRIVGLNDDTVRKWIARGRGKLPLPATPEYISFTREYEQTRATLVRKLVQFAIDGAEKDPLVAIKMLDKLDPNWSWGPTVEELAEETPEDLLRVGSVVAQSEPEPDDDDGEKTVLLTERVRTVTIPRAMLEPMLRGEKIDGDGTDRLAAFRETAGDVPTP